MTALSSVRIQGSSIVAGTRDVSLSATAARGATDASTPRRGRLRRGIELEPRAAGRSRLLLGFSAGTIMAFGTKLARGCTSGQALTGGAHLSVGSWVSIVAAFAAGYAFAPLFEHGPGYRRGLRLVPRARRDGLGHQARGPTEDPEVKARWDEEAELSRYFGGFPRVDPDPTFRAGTMTERLRHARRRGCAI